MEAPMNAELQEERRLVNAQIIQRQYDEIVAPHYDDDPQEVIGRSLDFAVAQVRQSIFCDRPGRLKVLDMGVGTGLFLSKLRDIGAIQPFGLDLSEKMIEAAKQRIPDMVAAVDDAANLDGHFPNESFDLISTHFLTGYVPMSVLAPKTWNRLTPGGYWSLIGGTKAGFPALQAKANSKLLRWFCGGNGFAVEDIVCNPANRDEISRVLENTGFVMREAQTFEPQLEFPNFDGFMDFAYRGGWLTPFIDTLGLQNANGFTRAMLNFFIFPVNDHHSIEIVLAQKLSDE
jgi:ubiquinone/menaquinone biosynthesis C-methylase UbiE